MLNRRGNLHRQHFRFRRPNSPQVQERVFVLVLSCPEFTLCSDLHLGARVVKPPRRLRLVLAHQELATRSLHQ